MIFFLMKFISIFESPFSLPTVIYRVCSISKEIVGLFPSLELFVVSLVFMTAMQRKCTLKPFVMPTPQYSPSNDELKAKYIVPSSPISWFECRALMLKKK